MHAGEAGTENISAEETAHHVLRAIDEFGAKRIGHGYQIVKDAKLLEEVKNRDVHFEICPTSCFEAGGWTGKGADEAEFAFHPMRKMIEAGLHCGINTDDPSVFDTDMEEEMRLVREEMKLGEQVTIQCVKNAVDAAFCLEAEKEKLHNQIDRYYNVRKK